VRQRAAWSLSNVISALCEHDTGGTRVLAADLQGYAVATCATVRKSLNDNDKVLLLFEVYCSCASLEYFYDTFFFLAGTIFRHPLHWNARSTRS
jgi:hypothetical protein